MGRRVLSCIQKDIQILRGKELDNDDARGQNLSKQASKQASKRSRATLICQPYSEKLYRMPKDRVIYGRSSTVSMNGAVFFSYPTGADPGIQPSNFCLTGAA